MFLSNFRQFMIDYKTPNIFDQILVLPLIPNITFTFYKIPKKYLQLGNNILVTSLKINVYFW